MKTVLAIALAATTLAALATAADARPRHKVCTVHHHHRVCHWVR